jgi:REP element-mobilizing transposase RayT
MELPKRKRIRLPKHNYVENGVYFITICSHEHAHIFGEIPVGQGLCPCRVGEPTIKRGLCGGRSLVYKGVSRMSAPCCYLSAIGKLIDEETLKLETRYTNIHVDKYVVMPNHVHLLLRIDATESHAGQKESGSKCGFSRQGQSPCPTHDIQSRESISDTVRTLKSTTTKRANAMSGTAGRKIWQYRFHDHIVRNEIEYLEIIEYIENNPMRWEQDRYCFTARTKTL